MKQQKQVQYIVDIILYFLLLGVAHGVTILLSEEDDLMSEFARNRDRKGFKDTKWKSNYYEMARTKALINTFHELIWRYLQQPKLYG